MIRTLHMEKLQEQAVKDTDEKIRQKEEHQ